MVTKLWSEPKSKSWSKPNKKLARAKSKSEKLLYAVFFFLNVFVVFIVLLLFLYYCLIKWPSRAGIPELKIPAFDPFLIPEIDLKVFEGISTMFGGAIQRSEKTKAFARNMTIHHSSEFILHALKWVRRPNSIVGKESLLLKLRTQRHDSSNVIFSDDFNGVLKQ